VSDLPDWSDEDTFNEIVPFVWPDLALPFDLTCVDPSPIDLATGHRLGRADLLNRLLAGVNEMANEIDEQMARETDPEILAMFADPSYNKFNSWDFVRACRELNTFSSEDVDARILLPNWMIHSLTKHHNLAFRLVG
jgi:hypothetical protein